MPILKKIEKRDFNHMDVQAIKTLGDLKKANYQSVSIKDEMRNNMLRFLKAGKTAFQGIFGYEDTVIPQLERAILARHNINLLGLRGQAKTKIARQLTNLLDEYIPVVAGSEVNDDPFHPISIYAKELIESKGDKTPIAWLHRSERYVEKLATPDVSIADLIGDIDPIKAANLKLSFSDERVLHFGLVPRANRSIFVINELPDLQARIQVALFNILQEGDVQIRGFKLRLPLKLMFVFTANPEDYTNRGSIITPLKDRIQSQILTHYPKNIAISSAITAQEAKILPAQSEVVKIPAILKLLVEQIAVEARNSDYVDAKSGVSARLTISAYENLVSTAERRALLNGEKTTQARISDLYQIVPAINGKIELVYEGEQEGVANVASALIAKAIRTLAKEYFPTIEKRKGKQADTSFDDVIEWFATNQLILNESMTESNFKKELSKVKGLSKLVKNTANKELLDDENVASEFVMHALGAYSLLGIEQLETGTMFSDLMGAYLGNIRKPMSDDDTMNWN